MRTRRSCPTWQPAPRTLGAPRNLAAVTGVFPVTLHDRWRRTTVRTRKLAVGLVALALAATACSSGTPSAPLAGDQPVQVPDAQPTVEAPTTTAPGLPSASPTASPTPRKPLPPPYDVKAVQRQLTEQRYYVGAIDGERGPAMRSAVMAFQKVNGLSADGTVGKATLAALKTPKQPVLRGSAPADRVEVDLTKQVLYVVKAGKVTRILPVSSGNGERYLQKSGAKATALTPVGYFKVQRRIIGERKADLGTLYDPQYFYKGWAIHGSNSVPAYPASHGCIRVTRTDAKWLLDVIGIGTTVYLYGGTHTFTAGSKAPGTDNPTGDTETATPTATPTRPASPSPTSSPTPSPSSAPVPVPTTSPTPRPTASATPTP
jgi:lipoprotein-anchoring transpeptidase ErfK/SrfK